MKDGLADVVQVLCGQYLRYFSYNGFCDLYNDNNGEVFNDSLEESNISSKLLGSLQSRFDKVFFFQNLILSGFTRKIQFILFFMEIDFYLMKVFLLLSTIQRNYSFIISEIILTYGVRVFLTN